MQHQFITKFLGGFGMQRYEVIEKALAIQDISALREALGNICYTCRDFSDGEFDEVLKYVLRSGINIMDDHLDGELVSDGKSSFVKSDFTKAVFMLKENFCKERIEDVKKIGKAVYGNSSHSISSNVSKQKLIINLIQKVANKIKDLLQKAIVTFKQALAKNSQFIKKYNESLIKNQDAVNNIEVEWIDIDELFSINNQFQVIAKPSYEDKINDAVQKSDVQECLSYLKGYKPKKITIKISDSRIGGIKNLLSMFDKLRFGNTGCWNVDEWRKKMNRASNVIANKKSNASDSEIKDSLLCQCYYLYARAMVNAQSSLLVSCKNALTKAIGVTYNIKESTINAAMQTHQNEASTVLNNIFIEVELPSMINEFNYFIKPLFNNTIISEGDNMAIKYLATTNNGYGSYDEFNAFMESNFGLNEGAATDYKTIDISDCGGVDITDTISDNFDNWEGIIPDNTIGDITAEFDSFLEAAFGITPPDLINEGMSEDSDISEVASPNYADYIIAQHDIQVLHSAMSYLYDNIQIVKDLIEGYKTGRVRKPKWGIYFSMNKTVFDKESLARKLKRMQNNYDKIEDAYNKMGGAQMYYAALAAEAQRERADLERQKYNDEKNAAVIRAVARSIDKNLNDIKEEKQKRENDRLKRDAAILNSRRVSRYV